MNGVLFVILALVGGAVAWAVYNFFFKEKATFEYVKTERLSSEDVIAWFKKPENLELIRSNSNLICVLLKGQEAMKYVSSQLQPPNKACVQALFDKEKNDVKKARVIEYRELDDLLASQFGDKDMVVFK